MPIESVDMFSGLDLSGSTSHAVQPEAMPPAAEAMVDRNVRWTLLSKGFISLPADCANLHSDSSSTYNDVDGFSWSVAHSVVACRPSFGEVVSKTTSAWGASCMGAAAQWVLALNLVPFHESFTTSHLCGQANQLNVQSMQQSSTCSLLTCADRNVPAVFSLSSDSFDAVLCSSGSLPLPADLFSGLEQLIVEPATASQSATFPTPAEPIRPLPSDATPAASGGPVLSGPSNAPKPRPQPSSTTIPTTSVALQEGNSLPPGQVLVPAPLAAAAPEGRRKKKTTRRVGYARDQPGEASTGRAASDTASLPSVSASTPDTAVQAADSRVAQPQPKPSVAVAPMLLVAVAADTYPVASTTAAAAAMKGPGIDLDMEQAPVSQLQALPSQPAQPKSPVNAIPHKKAPAAVSPKRHHHKAAASTAAAAAPAAVLQLTSLSLTDAVAAANLAAPLQPAGLASQGITPAALTSEALLQVLPYAWPGKCAAGSSHDKCPCLHC